MMKLASILKSRAHNSRQLMNNKNTEHSVYSFTGLRSLMNSASISAAGQNYSDRIYAPYAIYKGKAALSAEPIPPRFATGNHGSLKVKRQGYIMLSFSPSVGERKYDWERKQIFALSATEVGSLISMGPSSSCEFFHDPAIQTSNAGQVRKSLSVKPHADGSGYFFSLTVANNILKINERFTVPVTSAEFAVMRTSFSFALPYIMGWDRYTSKLPMLQENATNVGPKRLDSEWDR